jgi:hypothetical protein
VEQVYADHSLVDGHDLAIEFFEAICDADRVRFAAYTGPTSREWFDATAGDGGLSTRGERMEVIDEDNGDSVTVRLQRDELLAVNNALNEVLNGPDSIEDWEFHTRMSVGPAEARALLKAVGAALERLQRGD